jgi:HicB-like protein involved in pilus formation
MPAPGQITIRTKPDLVMRLKQVAKANGTSMNEYVEHLIEVALDPARATTEDERLVARLRAAGIYEEPGVPVERPDPALVARAREAFRGGRPLSEYVSMDRDE